MQKKTRILVVDDNNDFREFLKIELESKFGDQVSVQIANDGSEAVIKAANQKFECILTDFDMPKRNGDSFIKIVRERDLNRETPIIVITAKPDVKIDAKKVGILPKPLKNEVLIEALSKLLGIKQV